MPSSSRLLSRRHALRLAAWGAAAVTAPWARASNPPANTTDTAAIWRALSRLGYGPTPALIAQVQQAGGAQAWALAAIDAAFAASQAPIQLGGLPGDFDAPLPEIFERTAAERKARREQREAKGNAVAGPTAPPPAMTAPASAAPPAPSALRVTEPLRYIAAVARQSAAWKLLAASRPDLEHPLLARMSEFWFNHLNVSIDKGTVRPFAGHYQAQAIRGHALGRFEHLLLASARHPAMLYYLDQVQSVAEGTLQGPQRRGLNENYARELMELHTLGVNGGYSQSDVRELARVLTGWTVGPRQPDGFRFAPRGHDTGVKTVLGQRFGGNPDPRTGEAEGVAAIRMLAAHPATARRIALRLAQWFVADAPPPALVGELASSFQSSGGDTRALLRTLVGSSAFWDPAHNLFKTPYDYASSALAATGGPQDEREINQTLGLLQNAGQGVLRWPTPDGYKTDRATWLAPEALTHRADYALALARRRPAVDFLDAFMQPATLRQIDAQPPALRAGLLLASREFMSK
ncbi:DUF1800 family protein [Ottowia pentelensis]|uniref:DUF1800 family protein n=1 Tax=Ottowia pentelensis TaxID=511108 RepID=A0ABV6PXM1_9BURK